MKTVLRPLVLVSVSAIAAFATACAEEPQGSFVGAAGGEALFGIEVGADDSVRGYVCDGHGDHLTIGRWLQGEVEGNTIVLDGDDLHFDGSVVDGHLTGALSGSDDAAAAVAADVDLAAATGPAGILHDVEGDTDRSWVVDNDGQQRGAFIIDGSMAVAGALYDLQPDSISNVITATGRRRVDIGVPIDGMVLDPDSTITAVTARARLTFASAADANRFDKRMESVKVELGGAIFTGRALDGTAIADTVRVFRVSLPEAGLEIDGAGGPAGLKFIENQPVDGLGGGDWERTGSLGGNDWERTDNLGGNDWDIVSRPGTADVVRITRLQLFLGTAT